MKKGIILILAFLSICSAIEIQGQDTKADSLLKLFGEATHDTTRIKLLHDIGDLYRIKLPDSAMYYYKKSFELSEQLLRMPNNNIVSKKQMNLYQLLKAKSLRSIGFVHYYKRNSVNALESYSQALLIYEKINDLEGISGCYNNIGATYKNQGNYEKGLEYYLKSLKFRKELGDKEKIASTYQNIGIVFAEQGIYDKAIEYYLKALKINEESGYKQGIATCYINIGNLHFYLSEYDNALKNFELALTYYEELGLEHGIAACYVGIGAIFDMQHDFDKAIETFLGALKIYEKLDHKSGMSACYGNIGLFNQKQGKYEQSLKYFFKSLNISKEIGSKDGTANNYSNIANLYIKMADTIMSIDMYSWKANLISATEFAKLAFDLATEIKLLPTIKTSAGYLQKANTKLGNFKQALEYAEIYIALKDSMFSEEKTKAIAEMTTKYEAEKKQLQIEKMEKQKELDDKTIEAQQVKNRKQQIMIFSAVGGFLIVLVFSMIILRMFRQKRRANVLLAVQNDEINQQKKKIEEQNQNITDSIVYAQRIQRALFPPGDYMKQLLPKRFILYKPRDIVSGDFYWVSKKDGLIITAAADCTGHGVPGAMMSMLGVSILNEIVNTMQKLDAGEILNNLRTKIIDSLHQGGKDTQMYDGMDLALCLIDLKQKKVQFAGANCPLYLIREGELTETKADKMPISVHAMMEPFTNHTLKLQEGDLLYTFSDGYIDQFGGENDKRFTQRRFKKLLLDFHDKSMPEQKEKLEINLKSWQGNTDQIDDILVMGVRI